MSNVYQIKPLEKKSVVYRVEMYRNNPDGTTSWFVMEELFRWGHGFLEADMDINLPVQGDHVAYCSSEVGWGCEFDDSISIDFEFSEDISEEEQEEIREAYYEGGAGWLYDGEHEWLEEDNEVQIIAPYQVNLCDEDGNVIEENVTLKTREEVAEEIKRWHEENSKWPFPSGDKV